MTSVAPGWYKDPAEPTTQRYWDGEGWVGAALPADATPPPGPPPVEEPPPPTTEPAAAQAPAAAQQQPVTAPPGYPGGGYPLPPGSQQPPPVPGVPYPAAVPPAQMIGVPLASPGARLLARLIDITAVLVLNIIVNGWFAWRYWQEIEPVYREVDRRMTAGQPLSDVMTDLPQPGPQASTLQLVVLFIACALWFAYEVPAVANTGQTLGKRVLGIKVMGMEGAARLGFGRSLRRWNILGFPTLLWACCIGFVWQLVDCAYLLFDRPLQQAFHDKAARTVVVKVPHLPGPSASTPGGSP